MANLDVHAFEPVVVHVEPLEPDETGEASAPQPNTVEQNSSSLDEPVLDTILRDIKSIGRKVRMVLIPKAESIPELRNWDLWGPLVLCLVLAMSLGVTAKPGQSALVFAGVFVVVWLGSAIVTLNGQVLGGQLSFFQSVCVLGYCIFPLVLCSFIFVFLKYWIIRIPLAILACVWCCIASQTFLSGSIPPNRKALAVYPIVLFYLFIAWLTIVQS